MIFFKNHEQKVRDLIKKIDAGNATESSIGSLCELLESHQNLIQESVGALNNIMLKGNSKAFNSVIYTFNELSQNRIGLTYYSVEIIIRCMRERKNEISGNCILVLLEIISKITQEYPERMKVAVPDLLKCLEDTNEKSRAMSYFLLSILAVSHHEFFKDRSNEIIRALNGLYFDERIYACRLVKQLAETERTVALDTYDLLEDMRLNHPDCKLRSEAGFTMDKLIEVIGKTSAEKLDISENYFTGLKELSSPNKKDLIEILEGMGLRHMIIKRSAH